MTDQTQLFIDKFYKQHGDCCAGCDYWRWHNAFVGDCTKSAPVSSTERHSMLGLTACSLALEAGHILTKRDHVCGDFIDSHKWSETKQLRTVVMAVTDKELEEMVVAYARQDIEKALLVLASMFVGLHELYVQQRDDTKEGDHLKTLNLTGGYRDITIHPPAKQQSSSNG